MDSEPIPPAPAVAAVSSPMGQFVRGLPKAELHLHIEGTLEPELAFRLAAKHAVRLRYGTIEELRRAYQFSGLQSFLDLYYAGADILRDEEDFYLLADAYMRKAHAQGVVHVEPFFDPQTHAARGVAMSTMLSGLRRAQLGTLARNSIEASLLAPAEKRRWMAAIDAYVNSYPLLGEASGRTSAR